MARSTAHSGLLVSKDSAKRKRENMLVHLLSVTEVAVASVTALDCTTTGLMGKCRVFFWSNLA